MEKIQKTKIVKIKRTTVFYPEYMLSRGKKFKKDSAMSF